MMCRWISVNERLPELGQEVLVLLRGGARTGEAQGHAFACYPAAVG